MCEISLKPRKRDWQSLERKIAAGSSLEDAARQAGIPLEEVYQRVKDLGKEVDTLNYELRIMAQGSIEQALTKLKKLARGNARLGQHFESTDLLAARELAKFGIEALKLAKTGKAQGATAGEKDLFDEMDPWRLKAIE